MPGIAGVSVHWRRLFKNVAPAEAGAQRRFFAP